MSNFDDMKLAVEALSGGKNTVLFDDLGMPSIMVMIPKMITGTLITGATQTTHPGFIVDGVEKAKMAISKYQNIIVNDRAYSLPMQDPRASLTWQTALNACRKKGEGWGLTPYSLWGAIALWCRKNGTMPHGNNNYGKDINYPHETGVVTYPYTEDGVTRNGRTATGSGPATWYHDHTPSGIADLNGNVWEWNAGMRLVDGEIQIIPYANCMRATCDMGEDSSEWKAIKADGSLVEPGTAGTLKWDWVSGKIQLTSGNVTYVTDAGNYCTYDSMTLATGLTAPELAKALLLYPDEPGKDYGGDGHWMNTRGERMPLCGGWWHGGAGAGVFYVTLNDPRSGSTSDVGFRSAYVDL